MMNKTELNEKMLEQVNAGANTNKKPTTVDPYYDTTDIQYTYVDLDDHRQGNV